MLTNSRLSCCRLPGKAFLSLVRCRLPPTAPEDTRTFMSQEKPNPGEKKVSEKRGVGKKPYQKPEFRFERVFETMALSCGKISPTQFQCRFNTKNS